MPYEGTHNNTVWENNLSLTASDPGSVAPYYAHAEFNEKAIAGSDFDSHEFSAWADPKVLTDRSKLVKVVKRGLVGVSAAVATVLTLIATYQSLLPTLSADPVFSYDSASQVMSYSFGVQCSSIQTELYVSIDDGTSAQTDSYVLSPTDPAAEETSDGLVFSVAGSFSGIVEGATYLFSINGNVGVGQSELYSESLVPSAL